MSQGITKKHLGLRVLLRGKRHSDIMMTGTVLDFVPISPWTGNRGRAFRLRADTGAGRILFARQWNAEVLPS